MSTIALIAALANNRVIGRDNALPWRLPADMRFFVRQTMGKPIIMGRKTYESIGRPLPGRHNIVLTRQPAYSAPGCTVVTNRTAAVAAAAASPAGEIMIIGGGAIYELFLPIAARMYLTFVAAAVPGDVFFPSWVETEWRETDRISHPADEKHAYPFEIVTFTRLPAAGPAGWLRRDTASG